MKKIIKLSFCFALLISASGYAQVVTDGSLGAATRLSGQMLIPQSLGTTKGNNLFHSFSQFNINTGESATYTGNQSLRNVISRVTGGQASQIDGLLKSNIGNANFYFINPAGVAFGVNARIDVPAAFHVSTADKLYFADGSQFSASSPSASLLTISEPTGFGFLTHQGGNIELQGSSLTFKEGSAVSLSAHNVHLNNARLINPSGSFQVSATGDVVTNVPINSPVTTALTGRVDFTTGSQAVTSGNSGGKIHIQGGDIVIDNASSVVSDTLGTGNAKGISINASHLKVSNQGKISSSTFAQGSAGNIAITANDVSLSNSATILSDNIDGRGGDISLNTKSLTLTKGAAISTTTFGLGDASKVTVNADNVLIDGVDDFITTKITDKLIFTGRYSGFYLNTYGAGNGGNLQLNTNNLTLSDGAVISAVAVDIVDIPRNTAHTSAGSITLNANQVTIKGGAVIGATTSSAANAGSVVVNAKDTVTITGQFNRTAHPNVTLPHETDHSAILSNSSRSLNPFAATLGAGGSVDINAKNLILSDGGLVSVSTGGDKKAGVINLNATNALVARNGASITSSTSGAGSAGNINIIASQINLDNASISAEANALSQGQTGNIAITANQGIFLTNQASISLKNDANASNISTITPSSITVSGYDIDLKNSKITTEATGNVDSGDINITMRNNLTMDSSFITTAANTGNGGDIGIQGGQLIYLKNSGFLTSVSGANSNGGNIKVTSDYLVMDTGVIQANAVGGSGGNIDLNLKALISSYNHLILSGDRVNWQPFIRGLNVIQAVSESGVSGTISVTSPQFDISASVSGLDVTPLVMSDIDHSFCQSSAMSGSTLSRASKGGIPNDETQYGFIPPAKPSGLSSTALTTPLDRSGNQSGDSYPCTSLQP